MSAVPFFGCPRRWLRRCIYKGWLQPRIGKSREFASLELKRNPIAVDDDRQIRAKTTAPSSRSRPRAAPETQPLKRINRECRLWFDFSLCATPEIEASQTYDTPSSRPTSRNLTYLNWHKTRASCHRVNRNLVRIQHFNVWLRRVDRRTLVLQPPHHLVLARP